MIVALDGATVRTPAEHRAAVAAAGVSRRDVLGWPTADRLRHDRYRLDLLLRWRDLMEPPSSRGEPDPADRGRSLVIHRTDRPDEEELLEAAGRGPYVVMRREQRWKWRPPVRHSAGLAVGGTSVRLGELVFHAGELVRWGIDKRGRALTPYEKLTLSSRGARRKMPAGTSWRKAIDAGGDWDGLHQSSTVSLDDERGGDAFDDIARQHEARMTRAAIGSRHAEILDLAISSGTAKEIGEQFGFAGKYAETKGIRLTNDSLDAFGMYLLTCEAANDNICAAEVQIAA